MLTLICIIALALIAKNIISQLNIMVFIIPVYDLIKEFSSIVSNSICKYLTNFHPGVEFLSDIATFEGILIGITIPISLQIVTWTVDRYRDNEIAKFFIKESLYKFQFISLFPNILIAILLRFLNIDNSLVYFIILWFIFLWLVINIIIFVFFIKLVEGYVTNTDTIILNKLKLYVENILKK